MGALGEASRGTGRRRRTRRSQGYVERLPSGSRRIKVYAGRDALTGREFYLVQTVPAGPDAVGRAERTRARLVAQVAAGDHPRTDATIAELMVSYLAEARLARKTRATYLAYNGKHIVPLLGRLKINGSLDPELLDVYYAELARCRDHCTGRAEVRHWTARPHRCSARCRRHVCRPLKPWTIRKIHWMLNGAYQFALRRKWALTNSMVHAEPPAPPAARPQPPTVAEAARIVDAGWRHTDYGPMVWTALTTGARLGELCALRWRDVQVRHTDPQHVVDGLSGYDCLEHGCGWVVSISRSIEHIGLEVWETDTKTHQHRLVALDAETVVVLLDLRASRAHDARLAGREVGDEDFVFHHRSGPDTCLRPGAISTHYRRFTARLGIDTTFHKLRHYSATELITAGVDIRTVAGRLGHSGGGTTTLKVYAAWVSEADQRAAAVLARRVPVRRDTTPLRKAAKPARFQALAGELRRSIMQGRVKPGEPLPPMKQIAAAHRVSINSAHAAVGQLATWGYVTVSRGRRATVTDPTRWPSAEVPTEHETEQAQPDGDGSAAIAETGLAPVVGHIGTADEADDVVTTDQQADDPTTRLLQLRLRCDRAPVKTLCLEGDLTAAAGLQRIMRDVAATVPDDLDGMLELDLMPFGEAQPVMTLVLGQAHTVRQRFRYTG